jgi:D-sedoheptulose 7-phosphate isomerase
MDKINFIRDRITASLKLKTSLLSNDVMLTSLNNLVDEVVKCYNNGGKVLWAGNGGSAADAQHLAAELSGRFYYDRPPLFSDALHVNTSYLTAVSNDYGYELVYSRLTQAMGKKGDMLIGMSTSGNSENVINALIKAKEIGMITAGFTGETGGKMKNHCDFLINISSIDTPRIQECHMLLGHTLCEMVEIQMFPK